MSTADHADTPQTFVWGGASGIRILAAALAGLLLAAALALVVIDPVRWWLWVPFALLAIWYALGVLRRRCTLDGARLVAQGRFTRRVVPLADLTQVAVARGSTIWVKANHPLAGNDPVCLLPMASKDPSVDGTNVPIAESVLRIRVAAERAGARLEPLPAAHSTPTPRRNRMFGF